MEATDSNCCSQSNDWPTSYILALLPCYVAKIANKTLLSKIKMETVSEGYALFRIYNKVTPNIRIPAEYLLQSSCYTEKKRNFVYTLHYCLQCNENQIIRRVDTVCTCLHSCLHLSALSAF